MSKTDSPLPLYQRIYLQLSAEIISGERLPGSRMPTEVAITAQFGVSRVTAVRALDELARHKFVRRRPGIGTTVIYAEATPAA